jgi:hypothetical protein
MNRLFAGATSIDAQRQNTTFPVVSAQQDGRRGGQRNVPGANLVSTTNTSYPEMD